MVKQINNRIPEAPIDSMFVDRWSPRAFADKPIKETDLNLIFEAARWSPSCFNDQPWRFYVAKIPADKNKFLNCLAEKNQLWARSAPVLMFIVSRKDYVFNQKPNRWADFDTGAAWLALTLQANKLGLYTHGMAGYDRVKAESLLKLDPNKFNVIAAVALGYPGDPEQLPKDLREVEKPGMERRKIQEFVFAGPF